MRYFLRLAVVRIDDDEARLLCKPAIGLKQFFAALVAIGMVEVGIEDDGDLAAQGKKTALEFARLGHEVLPSRRFVITERGVLSADMAGARKSGAKKDVRKHGGRGSLAVAARD